MLIYSSKAGAMLDTVSGYEVRYNERAHYIGGLNIFQRFNLCRAETEIRLLNGEYDPRNLILVFLLRCLSAARITIIWHDVTPHHRKPYDLILWFFSFLTSNLAHNVIVHNQTYLNLGIAKKKFHFEPLPMPPLPEKRERGYDQIPFSNFVLFFGTIEPYKNLDLLIDAINELDGDIGCVIVGNFKKDRVPTDILKSDKFYVISEFLDMPDLFCLMCDSKFIYLGHKHYSQSLTPYWAYYAARPLLVSEVVYNSLRGIVRLGLYKFGGKQELKEQLMVENPSATELLEVKVK